MRTAVKALDVVLVAPSDRLPACARTVYKAFLWQLSSRAMACISLELSLKSFLGGWGG